MKYFLPFIIILFLNSCGENTNSSEKDNSNKNELKKSKAPIKIELKDLYFMEGNWQDISNTFEGFNEKWMNEGDSLLKVIGYTINGNDTIISEVIQVKLKKGLLTYIPRVVEQNEGKEINFGLSSGSTLDSFAFVNYEHDFPREIIYTKLNNKNVYVYLNGIDKNLAEVKLKLTLQKTN